MTEIATIPLRSATARIALIAVVIGVLGSAIIGAKWQFGDMLATTTTTGDEQAAIQADAALSLAPSDPKANALRSQIGPAASSTEHRSPVELAENAVRAAPDDHRWRITLARALVDAGRTDDAEIQFKHAVELAPSFAVCRWYYGNFLLRQGRHDEALAEFRVAAGSDQQYRPQVLALVWDYTHDVTQVSDIAGDGPDNIASLAHFLAAHAQPDAALAAWRRLSAKEKQARQDVARTIAQVLLEKRSYAASLAFAQEAGDSPMSRPEAVTNPSFESSLDSGMVPNFGWSIIRNDAKVDVAQDDKVSHEGRRSLRITFRATSRPQLFNAAQGIAVIAGARYRLAFWLRTENLKAAAGPTFDVATGDETKSLGHTLPFPNGTNEWRQMTVDFIVPADIDGIEIRMLRSGCAGDECLVNGIVWFDDFSLIRL